MWIFDSYYKGSVQLWGRDHGLIQASAAYPPSFYMHLPDPTAHRDMIEALESRFKTFRRTGFFKPMASKSYWSYDQVKHKDAALIPEWQVHRLCLKGEPVLEEQIAPGPGVAEWRF